MSHVDESAEMSHVDESAEMSHVDEGASGGARPGVEPHAAAATAVSAGAGVTGEGAGEFSVARVGKHFSGFATRVAGDAPEYMAAVLRCVTSKLLQGAGEAARDGEAARIEPRHIWQAVQHDGELASLAPDHLHAKECAPIVGSSAGHGEPSGERV